MSLQNEIDFAQINKDSLLMARHVADTKSLQRTTATHHATKHSGELWTSEQRKGSAIHEISYRACFKPQVPQYFINRHSRPGDIVYDPFMGRGTTIIEAVLAKRKAIGNDINPLSRVLVEPRLDIPPSEATENRLKAIDWSGAQATGLDLSMFYHRKTLREIVSLRQYLLRRKNDGTEDRIDRWIRMIATNRLTGHSPGFFSVYTLPPNQAASQEDQKRINRSRKQKPEYRNVSDLILRKSKRMLNALDPSVLDLLSDSLDHVLLMSKDARETKDIMDESVQLTVTSPPFLNIVNYTKDNWLRCWFNAIPLDEIQAKVTASSTVEQWSVAMGSVFDELFRVTKRGGIVAFEVGEIRKNTIKLEDVVLPLGTGSGFELLKILINVQQFTKTSHIWGVRNNTSGTNTNRIVLFKKR